MTDQQIAKYATSKTPMPPLTKKDRSGLLAQVDGRLPDNPSDQVLARAVVASWARRAARAQQPNIARDLAIQQYAYGDPETNHEPSGLGPVLALGLLAMIAALVVGNAVCAYLVWVR